MNDISHFEVIIAVVAIGGLMSTAVQFILTSRGRKARTSANGADAMESLTETVNNLSDGIRKIRAQLDIERKARLLAEAQLSILQQQFDIMAVDYRRMMIENEARLAILQTRFDKKEAENIALTKELDNQ